MKYLYFCKINNNRKNRTKPFNMEYIIRIFPIYKRVTSNRKIKTQQ